MKKLLTLVVCLLMIGGIYAQEQHLAFKGVPIDGALKDYKDAMIKAGFHYEGEDEGVALLSGDFAGFKNVMIAVYTLANCDVVSHIAVIFPENSTWSELLTDYENLKDMMTKKYGRPKDCQERFTSYVSDSGDLRLTALSKGEYEWHTNYETDLGSIKLTISKGMVHYHTGCAVLIYQDKINSDKVKNSAIDDL